VVHGFQAYIRVVRYESRGPPKLAELTHRAVLASVGVPPGYQVADDTFGWSAEDRSVRGLWLVFAVGLALVLLAVALVFDSVWASVMAAW
jgi:hypothetical protein